MRTSTPPSKAASVQVTMVFSPVAASSPDAFQVYDSSCCGTTVSTSQSVTPFQPAIAAMRKLKR